MITSLFRKNTDTSADALYERRKKFVLSLYRNLLGREPEPGAVDHWIRRIDQRSPEDVYADIIASDEYRARQSTVPLFVPPGHFYSPVVNPAEAKIELQRSSATEPTLNGIDLREDAQVAFIDEIRRQAPKVELSEKKTRNARYHALNNAFSFGDATVFAIMLLSLRPRHLIEAGSGYSSALALDIIEKYIDWQTHCTFIDPYPKLLNSLISKQDSKRVTIRPEIVQQVPLNVFDDLGSGDILFIDSTHVVKTGSDVLYHFEKVLPRLASGVVIHIHDIFYPFEYPTEWIMDMNRSWNELYYVRAFLSDNPNYEILFFNDFMGKRHLPAVQSAAPDFARDPGSSLWIRKR